MFCNLSTTSSPSKKYRGCTNSSYGTLSIYIIKFKKDIITYICFILFILLCFVFISSKDYSFLLVLSSLIQSLSFLIILIKVLSTQNTSGLSLNTLYCYLCLLLSRLSSTLFFNGYLPYDASGDWLYQVTEICSVCFICLLIYYAKYHYTITTDFNLDKDIRARMLIIPCFIFALMFHTTLNNFYITDVLWSFSMYVEGFAIFPQIKVFVNKKGTIESYTSHYVALCGLSRVFSLLFWVDTFKELNMSYKGNYTLLCGYCGYFIILSQIIQLIIMCDYYYLYFRALYKGENIIINDIEL